jgi:hypothetical protein
VTKTPAIADGAGAIGKARASGLEIVPNLGTAGRNAARCWITGDLTVLPRTRGAMLFPWAKMNWIMSPVLESRGGRRWLW